MEYKAHEVFPNEGNSKEEKKPENNQKETPDDESETPGNLLY